MEILHRHSRVVRDHTGVIVALSREREGGGLER